MDTKEKVNIFTMGGALGMGLSMIFVVTASVAIGPEIRHYTLGSGLIN